MLLDDGMIHLVPLSDVMITGVKDLSSLADVSFSTHQSPVSCLYATDARQSEKDHLLFSGSSDGWVYMFDLEYGFQLL